MAGTMKRRGISRFALVWILIFVCAAILVCAGLFFLHTALEEFEAVQPGYTAEKVFHTYFVNGSADTLLGYSLADVSDFEDRSLAVSYFDSVLSAGNLSYKQVISADPEVTLYAVSAGDVTFASFSLVDGERQTELLKLRYPALRGISVSVKPLYGTVIYAPLVAEVRVNGKLLGEEHIEGEPVVLADAPYFPADDPDFQVMVNYSVAGLFAAPEVSVRYPGTEGEEFALTFEEGIYSAEKAYLTRLAAEYNRNVLISDARREGMVVYREEQKAEAARRAEEERQRISDEIKAQYGSFILKMSEQYNRFIYYRTSAALQNETKIYFEPKTDIYTYVTGGSAKGYYNWSDYRVTKMEFVNEETSYFEWLDEAHTDFKCRISLTVAMYGYNNETGQYYDDNEPFRMTAYVHVTGGKPLVYRLLPTDSDLAAGAETAS